MVLRWKLWKLSSVSIEKVSQQNWNFHCSKCLRIVEESSAYFSLEYPVDSENTSARIAPGMAYHIRIIFRPAGVKDYLYKINFVTEEEQFEVPVYDSSVCEMLLN
nr:unnamed protein product [Callosobruchus chinensis]